MLTVFLNTNCAISQNQDDYKIFHCFPLGHIQFILLDMFSNCLSHSISGCARALIFIPFLSFFSLSLTQFKDNLDLGAFLITG